MIRFVNGQYSWRYGNQFKLARDFSLHGLPLVPYVSVEPFYDSQYRTISRYRYEAGTAMHFGKVWALAPYYARQKSRAPSESFTNAIGLKVQAYLP
jgi:hypothetical protein